MNKLYFFVFFFGLYEFTVYITDDMILPGMIHVVTEFGVPITYSAMALSLYFVGACFAQLFVGPLAERFGNRKVIIFGSCSFLVFAILIIFSSNITQFLALRIAQGTGLAYIAMGYALINDKFNDKTAVRISSILVSIALLSPLLGPIFGALILSYSEEWRYIFIITTAIALLSTVGLTIFSPTTITKIHRLEFRVVIKQYIKILQDANFRLGVICVSLAYTPLLIWLALAPNMILKYLGLSRYEFIIYQIIAVSGLSLATVITQFIVGKLSFSTIIRIGAYISFVGALFSVICSWSMNLVAIGLFFCSFGNGILAGSVMRILLSSEDDERSTSMAASLISFSQFLFWAMAIEIANLVSGVFNYSPLSFTLCCFAFVVLATILLHKFANNNAKRQWR